MTTHTHGPWETLADNGVTIIGYGNGFQVICSEVSGATRAEAQANARLIAAAPELLEACQSALESLEWHVQQDAALTDCVEDDIVGHGDIQSLKDAIAKAEGRTP